MESGSESNGTQLRINLDGSHGGIFLSVDGGNGVDVLNNLSEGIVESFLVQLEFQKSSVHLVHKDDRSDSLLQSLTEDSLSLDTDTGYSIYNNQSSVSDTKSSSDLGKRDYKLILTRTCKDILTWFFKR